MEHSAYIDLSDLSEEAKRELMEFYSYLIKKYKLGKGNKSKMPIQKKHFNALSIDTIGYKFNRDEANER
jgi:hypothetical protein